MGKLEETVNAYKSGKLAKNSFIEAMGGCHSLLFEYKRRIAEINVAEIKISAGQVLMTFKDPRISMICPPGDTFATPFVAFNLGDYESEELQIIRKIVGMLGGNRVRFLDIGANMGFYSLALSYYFPGIRGIAFEPIPTTYDTLVKNLKLNEAAEITPVNMGLSDCSGKLDFYCYPDHSGAASMTHNIQTGNFIKLSCPTQKLDDYFENNNQPIDFIKCDVEGAELPVFKGGRRLLEKNKPVIFSEMLRKWSAKYNYHPNDIIALLAELGYDCFIIAGDSLVVCPAVTNDTAETNFIFLHKTKHRRLVEMLVNNNRGTPCTQ